MSWRARQLFYEDEEDDPKDYVMRSLPPAQRVRVKDRGTGVNSADPGFAGEIGFIVPPPYTGDNDAWAGMPESMALVRFPSSVYDIPVAFHKDELDYLANEAEEDDPKDYVMRSLSRAAKAVCLTQAEEAQDMGHADFELMLPISPKTKLWMRVYWLGDVMVMYSEELGEGVIEHVQKYAGILDFSPMMDKYLQDDETGTKMFLDDVAHWLETNAKEFVKFKKYACEIIEEDKKESWQRNSKGVYADFADGVDHPKYYTKCPNCRQVNGTYDSFWEAWHKRLCPGCHSKDVEKLKKEVEKSLKPEKPKPNKFRVTVESVVNALLD